jgi:hypothetical protein
MNSIIGLACGGIVSKVICYSLGLPDPIHIVIEGTTGTVIVLSGVVLGGVIGYLI